MEIHAPQVSSVRFPGRAPVLALLACLLLLACAGFFLIRALTSEDAQGGTVSGPVASPFAIHYPAGWEPQTKQEIAALSGSPLAVLRRNDGDGVLIVNRRNAATSNLDKISRQLDRDLKARIPDFRKVSSRTVNIGGRPALVLSYVRTTKGTAHTVVAVPAGKSVYSLNAVVAAGDRDAAAEAGRMIASFEPGLG